MSSNQPLHHKFWPEGVPFKITLPDTTLFYNLEVSAKRYPNKPFLIYYDKVITYKEFYDETLLLAGYLQNKCEVNQGDRVLLYMQNSPQFIMGYYAILRANAVVVPVNPMNMLEELRHYISDSDAKVALVAQNLLPQITPLVGNDGLSHIISATYSDYIDPHTSLSIPDFVSEPAITASESYVHSWRDAINAKINPGPELAQPDDLCVMPYTSGTTGNPKGCMHTHRTVMSTTVASTAWVPGMGVPDSVLLSVLPNFHVTGMIGGMHSPIFSGATVVIMSRWDRDVAAYCIEKFKVTGWTSISTMMIDFLANPNLSKYDLSSLKSTSGGGAAMPKAVAQRLEQLTSLKYLEGYGMTETMAGVTINPKGHSKEQCLGIPVFSVDVRVVNPDTLEELPQGETGEIIVSAPQVMLGYWKKPESNLETFIELDGKRFLRTGDLGYTDEDGYFFMVDRLKRMINASGFKVWPTEVETMMYRNEHIQEACVIGAKDPKRGETVKAYVVLKAGQTTSEQAIIDWCHDNMAAYKVPKIIEFVDSLPKSGTGKVMWRHLQDQQNDKDKQIA